MLTQDVLNISNEQITINISPQDNEVRAVEICQLLRRVKNNKLMDVDENIVKAADLINQLGRDSSTTVDNEIVIAKAMDASMTIDITTNDMKVVVTINAAWGGKKLSVEDLNQQLSNNDITHGLCSDTFEKQIAIAKRLKPGQELSFDAAYGSEPINGLNATFKVLVNTMENRELKPQTRSNGKVDMHDLGALETVAINTPLIKRIPPTLGQPGFNIFGNELPAIDGEQIPFRLNDGTQISPLDDNLLVSTIEGIPGLLNGDIIIHDVLIVKNVDIGFGNIDFKGNVVIEGDVCEGLTVISQGDITVGGCVNSANLQAQGNITVTQGIFGKKKSADESLTCHVNAGGSVTAQYIQYSHIIAGGNVNANTQLLHSHVISNESVIVANKASTKGTIFGGKISARKLISAVELGGSAGSKTQLILNANLNGLHETVDKKQQLLSKEFVVLQQLIAAHDKVSSITLKQDQQQLLNKLKRNIDKKVALIVDAKKSIAVINEQILLEQQSMSIMAKGTLFDGVHITMDEQTSQILEHYQAIKIVLNNNKIIIAPLADS